MPDAGCPVSPQKREQISNPTAHLELGAVVPLANSPFGG